MSKDLLLTVSIGVDAAARYTMPRMRNYANRHGIDFLLMTESTWFERPVFAYWEALYELAEGNHDRILVLDSDILIRNDAPNIFDVPFEHVAMKRSGQMYTRFLQRVRDQIAPDFCVKDMFNSGVILIERPFLARIAEKLRRLSSEAEQTRFADQVYFCQVVKEAGVVPTHLSWRWNQSDDVPDFRAVAAHFLHFLGPDKERRISDYLNRDVGPEWKIGDGPAPGQETTR